MAIISQGNWIKRRTLFHVWTFRVRFWGSALTDSGGKHDGTRRDFSDAVLGADCSAWRVARAAEPEGEQAKHAAHATSAPRVFTDGDADVSDLPHEMDGGVKYQAVAER